MPKNEQNSAENQTLLNEIGSEVSQESAPLLQFITQNGGKIAAVVLLFLLITGLSAGWQWYQKKGNESYLEEMANLEGSLTGKDRNNAMNELVKRAPSALTTLANLTLGDICTKSGDNGLAAEAYAKAAQTDADGATGLMAALGQAQSLLRLEKYAEALSLLESLEPRFSSVPLVLRQLKAEAALRDGKTELASQIFAEMAKEASGDDAAYLISRSEALTAQTVPAENKKSPDSKKTQP